MTHRIVRGVALILALAGANAAAQQYPAKPVRILVGFAAGGSVDLVGRTVAQRLSTTWGRQVVIDNRPGAASHIAGNLVAKADPDGYTLLVSSMGGLGTNLALYKSLPYNALKDLSPLALLVRQGQVLIVNPSLPVRNVKDYIALARARPGELTYGSAGIGGPLHLAAELFSNMAGVKLSHIGYKGGALVVIDVLGGQITSSFQPEPEAIPHVKTGRVRAIAVTGANRSAQLPNIPTIAESGVPGYAFASWMGAAGPAGLPRDLQARISADINAALKSPEVQGRLNEVGLEILGGTPEQMLAHMQSELTRVAQLVKAAGIPLIE
jgi:tripartite-type tricarboxylate transporter receptor subunit TctC